MTKNKKNRCQVPKIDASQVSPFRGYDGYHLSKPILTKINFLLKIIKKQYDNS